MPIVNIIDDRKNKYNTLLKTVIAESACHDNSAAGATQYSFKDEGIFIQLHDMELNKALEYFNQMEENVTLHLRDDYNPVVDRITSEEADELLRSYDEKDIKTGNMKDIKKLAIKPKKGPLNE